MAGPRYAVGRALRVTISRGRPPRTTRIPLGNQRARRFARANGSALDPLREPLFRSLWFAAVISYTGTWMQNVGAGWLMTQLTMSPLMIGLVQAASTLDLTGLGFVGTDGTKLLRSLSTRGVSLSNCSAFVIEQLRG